jgi:hypothetical protein
MGCDDFKNKNKKKDRDSRAVCTAETAQVFFLFSDEQPTQYNRSSAQ